MILNNRKVLGTILGTVLFICCLMYFTYAYYVWRSDNTGVNFVIEDNAGKISCFLGPDVNANNIGPVLDYQDGVKAEFNITNTTESASVISVVLNITSISETLKVESFRYKLIKDSNSGSGVNFDYDNPVVEGNFANFVVGSNVIADNISVGAGGDYSFQFIVYIDGNVYNDSNMQENSLVSSLQVGNCEVSDELGANSPNLDDGNLIPVYYDETATDTSDNSVGAWRKADSYNKNNSWYDYDNKKWANAVLISDSTSRTSYQSDEVDTLIPISDIDAFLVWIPRFKYRVWNITRQSGDETTYAYSAYTNGIDIAFEKSIFNTGNVECTYDVTSVESSSNLSDRCVYNDTDVITTESVNANYTDAWYTHPSFTFGGKEKTGFWIGKFETTGRVTYPTVLPDEVSLTLQNVYNQFTTSKVFQSYGLSNLVDAHMLTNLEWGAVAYLTHSIYGLCSEGSCRDVYINNSSSYYTGRSAGVGASDSSVSVYGNYNYKGYAVSSGGTITTSTQDITKVSSSNGNVTGVYDMSGGSSDRVMSNVLNINNGFNFSDESWEGNIPSTIYYNAYSYGEGSYVQDAYNRSYLGDAMAEIGTDVTSSYGSWYNAYSMFPMSSSPWLTRGGYYQYSSIDTPGSFNFYFDAGRSLSSTTFRLSIS